MENKGWIKMYRSVTEHWLWEDKPFAKGQAWLDLVAMANSKARKFTYKNEVISLKRGELVTSELRLMERFGWGKTKLRNFLELLEKDGMIIKKATKKQTIISIVNYNEFQSLQTTDKLPANQEQTTDKLPANTNKNIKNIRNKEEKKYNAHAREKMTFSRGDTRSLDDPRWDE